jgi:predicted ribosomally synthesized peptide with SipW-like signal peptide
VKRSILLSLLVIGAAVAVIGGATVAQFSDPEEAINNTFQAGTLDLQLWDSGSSWANGADGEIEVANMAPGVESDAYTVRAKNFGTIPGKVSWEITDWTNNDGSKPIDSDITGHVSPVEFAEKLYVSYVYFDRDTDNNLAEPGGGDGSAYTFNPTDECSGITSPVDVTTWAGLTADERKCIVNHSTWPGAPLGINDEWVLPDWMRWADKNQGNNDGNLSVWELWNAQPWGIDDLGGATAELDPGEVYRHVLKFTLAPDVGNKYQAEGINVTFRVKLEQ